MLIKNINNDLVNGSRGVVVGFYSKAKTSEEETKLSPKICFVRIDQIGNRNRHDDSNGRLDGGGYGDSFGPDAGGRYFAEDGISYGSDALKYVSHCVEARRMAQTQSKVPFQRRLYSN